MLNTAFRFVLCFLFFAFFILQSCGGKNEPDLSEKEYRRFAEALDSALDAGNPNFLKTNSDLDELGEERARKLKLRLADVKNFKQAFSEGMQAVFDTLAWRGKGGDFEYIRYEQKNGEHHAFLRLFYEQGGINYYDFILGSKNGKPVVRDIYVFIIGRTIGEAVGSDASSGMKRSDSVNTLKIFREQASTGNVPETILAYNTLPKKYREVKSVLLQYMSICSGHDAEEYAAAAATFKKLYRDDAGYNLLMFDDCSKTGDYRKSIYYLDELDKIVKDPLLDYYRANLYSAMDSTERSLELFRKVAENMPGLARERSCRAILNTHIYYSEYDKALAVCKELVSRKFFTKQEVEETLLEEQTLFLLLPDVVAWLGE
ncbi:MAG: hypothetical protein FD123_232 [Bacteroidetes bacterium]|nr:MAG: hypothetical protein FD123_232 [Bacteroidota bacterium]